jgi:hypothetical protein
VGSLVLLEERRERSHVAFVQRVHCLRARVVRLCRWVVGELPPLTVAHAFNCAQLRTLVTGISIERRGHVGETVRGV